MDISFSLEMMGYDLAKAFLEEHNEDYLLFGSDSPWEGQAEAIANLKALNLDNILEEKILGQNALRLLGTKVKK